MEKIKVFDSVQSIIKACSSSDIKPLEQCDRTIDRYLSEQAKNHPYRQLAERFITFNDLWKRYGIDFIKSNKQCICEDKLFYSFLRNRKTGNDKEYEFPLKDGGIVTGKVDIYNPFVEVEYQGEIKSVVDPKWHILIANYAYIDAAFNYQNDIKELAGWTDRKPIKRRFSNNVINVWMDENNINP